MSSCHRQCVKWHISAQGRRERSFSNGKLYAHASYSETRASSLWWSKQDVCKASSALHLRFVAENRFTFVEDLQQLVEHFLLQLFTGSASAPEAPAKPQR